MIQFLLGLVLGILIGTIVGTGLMCILQIIKEDD